MKYKIFLVLFMLINVISSCKKSNNKITESSNKNDVNIQFIEPLTLIDPSNPNNPYDKIGYFHNIGMEAIGNFHLQNLELDKEVKEENFEALKIEFANMVDREFKVSNTRFIWMNYCSGLYDCYKSNRNLYINSLNGISVLQRIWLSELFGVIDGFDIGDTTVEDKVFALNKLKSRIIGLESALLINDSFTEKEKAVLLSAASVARYSMVYSISTLSNLFSPWILANNVQSGYIAFNEVIKSNLNSIRSFALVNGLLIYADWGAIGRSDVSGAVGGAVAGAAGLFIPGVGWMEWGVAVLGGGLGNSASELTNQLLSGDAFIFP